MYEVLLHIHSLTPYLFILLMLVVLIMAFVGFNKGRFSGGLRSLARVALILAHLQLLIGIFMLASQAAVFTNGMGTIMKEATLRFKYIEHPFTMILAVALITIGFARSKRADTDKKKARNILIFYAIGLLLILSRLPYQVWLS
jgi:heme A synthase